MKIFVFGANRAGRHGKGAALFAKTYRGAVVGQGEGLQGHSYGIPTKDENVRTLSLNEIEKHVNTFIEFAINNPSLQFQLTPIGCGLAGYTPEQIAPFFRNVPKNVELPVEFLNVLS